MNDTKPSALALDWAWDAVTQFPGAWRESTLQSLQHSLAHRFDTHLAPLVEALERIERLRSMTVDHLTGAQGARKALAETAHIARDALANLRGE